MEKAAAEKRRVEEQSPKEGGWLDSTIQERRYAQGQQQQRAQGELVGVGRYGMELPAQALHPEGAEGHGQAGQDHETLTPQAELPAECSARLPVDQGDPCEPRGQAQHLAQIEAVISVEKMGQKDHKEIAHRIENGPLHSAHKGHGIVEEKVLQPRLRQPQQEQRQQLALRNTHGFAQDEALQSEDHEPG
mgnify:CR=1 FL=1